MIGIGGNESNGIRVDTELLNSMVKFATRLEELRSIYEAAGTEFNIDYEQLSKILLKIWYAVIKKTKTGASTDAGS